MKMEGGLSPMTLNEKHAVNDAIFEVRSVR